jgi:predicted transcriptional regulator
VPISVKVRDVMDKNLLFIESGTSVSDVIKRMVNEKVWSVLVSKKGLPIGVVTDRDILRRCLSKGLNPDRVKAEEIMSAPLLTIDSDASIGEAMHMLITKDVRRLYVIEGGKAVGRLTQTSVFDNVFDSMESLLTSTY